MLAHTDGMNPQEHLDPAPMMQGCEPGCLPTDCNLLRRAAQLLEEVRHNRCRRGAANPRMPPLVGSHS